MNVLVFFFVPIIIFMGLVAPLWLVLHYLSKRKSVKGLAEEDRIELDQLLKTTDQLLDRIEVLERILDVESVNWRQRDDVSQMTNHANDQYKG
ncbi:envelope stress response membrane protein PspB [Marinomonas agarivorans]|nr:envelope stress response membrane protein PspB [Marinomonas agarivorans]